MNRKLLGSLGLLGVVLAAGCGSDESGGSGGAGGVPAGDITSYAQAYCAAQQRCYPDFQMPDDYDCVGRQKLSFESQLYPGMSVGPAWFGSCAAAINAASCDDYRRGVLPACDMPPGTLPAGSPCVAGGQCETRSCSYNPSGCGVCEACGGAVCEPGAMCVHGACVEMPDQLGEACVDNCYGGLLCRDGICVERSAAGEPCSEYNDCGQGLFCVCDLCIPIEGVGEGEGCDIVATGQWCMRGLWCNSKMICERSLDDGSPCVDSDSCLFPASCENGVCTLPKPETCQ